MKIIRILALLALTAANVAAAQNAQLFVIERSKNANIVRYDARVGDDGSIDGSRPVEAYWLLKAKDGGRKDLTAFDRKAYGFETAPADKDAWNLKIKAFDRRDIRVSVKDGRPVAEMDIDGKPAVLEKIFITSVDRFPLPKVTSIELYGRADDGRPVHEKINP